WILALSIMASTARSAWMRMTPQTRVPMSFTQDGRPGVRLKRNAALLALPVAAFVVGMVLVIFNRNAQGSADQAVIAFGVRATAAALFALAHLRWLKAALAALDAEGALKDPQ
ncbi:MAG TPA: hypothetical protein VFW47_04495, partial [Phenylobacterium sp.]|nr:hypothetical protein [Phenylobacterium sp.]